MESFGNSYEEGQGTHFDHPASHATDDLKMHTSKAFCAAPSPDTVENWSRWRYVVSLAKQRQNLDQFGRRGSLPPNIEDIQTAPDPSQLSVAEALARTSLYLAQEEIRIPRFPGTQEPQYCSICYTPLRPDPKPENLYIFLHALRYTTSLGTFETKMPPWAAKGWKWDGRSRFG